MVTVQQLLSSLFLFLEKIKGRQVVTVVKTPTLDAASEMVGKAFSGYEISIYCQRKQYCRRYQRRFIRPKYFVLYRVFCVIGTGAPADVIEACQLDVDIPQQLPRWVAEPAQRVAAISAYLDLVLARLAR